MSSTSETLRLSVDSARALVLTSTIEEVDRGGEVLALDARREATRTAREKRGEWLGRRGLLLRDRLVHDIPQLGAYLKRSDPGRGLVLPLCVLAFVVGLATNALGPQRHIHVLALPLLGLIAWNLAVFLFLALRGVLPISLGEGSRLLAIWQRFFARPPRGGEGREVLVEALARDFALWAKTVAPLARARIDHAFHAAAAAMVTGVVVGMYLRGVIFAYRATWESTFLSSGMVDGLLRIVLGPAAFLLARDVPSAALIESPQSGDAGPWIHLWAVTALLFVILPRAVLALRASLAVAWRSRRLEVEVPGSWRRRLHAAAEAVVHRVEVIPYSTQVATALGDALRARLQDVFGARAEIRILPTATYGTEFGEVQFTGGRARVLLFGLAQTPEIEVHGEFARELREELPDGQALLFVVEASSFRERLPEGEAGEKRLAERRRAWDRIAKEAGLAAIHLDLKQDSEDEIVRALIDGAWPDGSLT